MNERLSGSQLKRAPLSLGPLQFGQVVRNGGEVGDITLRVAVAEDDLQHRDLTPVSGGQGRATGPETLTPRRRHALFEDQAACPLRVAVGESVAGAR